jgi:hypothetical protein
MACTCAGEWLQNLSTTHTKCSLTAAACTSLTARCTVAVFPVGMLAAHNGASTSTALCDTRRLLQVEENPVMQPHTLPCALAAAAPPALAQQQGHLLSQREKQHTPRCAHAVAGLS